MPGKLKLHVDGRPVICPRCKPSLTARTARRARHHVSIRHSSTASSTTNLRQQPAYTHLSNRSLIRLQGTDVVDFLNGLLPARLQSLQKEKPAPIFTAFLSAKGRILYDAFIYPPTDSSAEGPWYIEVDGKSAPTIFSHLKKHKLRRKFKLEKVSGDELGVYYIWPGQENVTTEEPVLGGPDPRPLMGARILSSATAPSQILRALQDTGAALSLEDYTVHRMVNGHAEGPSELVSTSALPQESNLDFDGGIDFHKGCYLGQELTIRTHHTGIVRKRILPCQISIGPQQIPPDQPLPVFDASLSVPVPPPESNILKMHAKGRAGRSTGKWLGGVGNIGLALCRLETMTDIQLTAEASNFDHESEFAIVWEDGEADSDGKSTLREVRVRPFVPQWLRDGIEAGIKARTDRSKRRRQEEDEDEDLD